MVDPTDIKEAVAALKSRAIDWLDGNQFADEIDQAIMDHVTLHFDAIGSEVDEAYRQVHRGFAFEMLMFFADEVAKEWRGDGGHGT